MAQEKVLNVIDSNDVSLLCTLCAELMKSEVFNDTSVSPLLLDKVIIMNKGMQTYIQQKIASLNGICSGIEFEQIWSFIWDLHKAFNNADKYNRFSHEHLTWSIYSLVDKWSNQDDLVFKQMSTYIKSEDGQIDKERAYQLAGVIADTYDQYQMYRPEWILAWDKIELADFEGITVDSNQEIQLPSGKIKEFIESESKKNPRKFSTLIENLWQIKLWVLLRDNLVPANTVESLYDRPTVVTNLIKKFDSFNGTIPANLRAKLPKKLFIFGVSALPNIVIDLFVSLGKVIPVFFMHLNPCQDYWGDLDNSKKYWLDEKKKIIKFIKANALIKHFDVKKTATVNNFTVVNPRSTDEAYLESVKNCYEDNNEENNIGELVDGNSLLVSMGTQGKDTLNVLLSKDNEIDFTHCFANSVNDDEKTHTLLNYVKDSLLNLTSQTEEKQTIKGNDLSLQVHACHTIKRELEVLRDSILNSIKNSDKPILPKDILVMVPNIETYAPYIDSVFGSIEKEDPCYLPYTVSDKSTQSSNEVADAIIKLLSIGISPISANLIIELLSVKPLAEKFNISTEELSVIISWFNNTKIHWGFNQKDVCSQLHTQEEINLPWTIEAGLDRLFYGFMTGSGHDTFGFENFDSSDYTLLGKLYAFIDKLNQIRAEFDPNLDSSETAVWTYKLKTLILDGCFVQDPKTQYECSLVEEILVEMNEAVSHLKNDSEDQDSQIKITLPVFRAKLIHAFGNTHDSNQYLRGSINFCSLMPMRAVPFKHIYILGLNDTDFPRKDTAPSFNLMGNPLFKRKNDRSRIIDDRFIFLEAILSAQESLYLSYLGESPTNKAELNPSVVLTELKDYINDHFKLESNDKTPYEAIFHKETLNSYDPKNYQADNAVLSFNVGSFWDGKLQGELQKIKPLGLRAESKIEIKDQYQVGYNDLLQLFRGCSRQFLKERFNISLNVNYSNTLQDEEPFEIDFKDKNSYLKDYLDKNLSSSNYTVASDYFEMLYQKGCIPFGQLKENQKDDFVKQAEDLVQQAKAALKNGNNIQDTEFKLDFPIPIEETKDKTKVVSAVFSGTLLKNSNIILDLWHKKDEISFNCYMQALINSVIYAIEKPHTPITHYIFTKDGECTRFVFDREQYSVANLKLLLNDLIEFYIRFSSIPTPVSSKLIEDYFSVQYNDDKKSKAYQELEVKDALVKLWNDNSEAVLFRKDNAVAFLFEGSDIFNHFDELSNDQQNLIISFFEYIKEKLVPIIKGSIKADLVSIIKASIKE